jgi:desulfoferrodoxin (superoxide reductase-like protein)
MKRTTLISKLIFAVLFLALTILSFSPQISYADAPKDVTIKYDSASQNLAVTITHKSLFPGMHHIKTVEIKKNNNIVSTTNYDTQPKDVPFTYTYKVETAKGDKLEATATCNISGSKTASLTISAAVNAGK